MTEKAIIILNTNDPPIDLEMLKRSIIEDEGFEAVVVKQCRITEAEFPEDVPEEIKQAILRTNEGKEVLLIIISGDGGKIREFEKRVSSPALYKEIRRLEVRGAASRLFATTGAGTFKTALDRKYIIPIPWRPQLPD